MNYGHEETSRAQIRLNWTSRIAAALLLVAVAGGVWFSRTRCSPIPGTEIYRGVTYGCSLIAEDDQGGGCMHWVRVDLSAPGIELYVTPMEPDAVAEGWQYRLQSTDAVVRREHLAVGINACLFVSDSNWIQPRRFCALGGNRRVEPRGQPCVGAHLPAVVRR